MLNDSDSGTVYGGRMTQTPMPPEDQQPVVESLEQSRARYDAACHAMQSGVAWDMTYESKDTDPKHLRVGVNSAHVSTSGLVSLLIEKGLFTVEEYSIALANAMDTEVDEYEKRIREHLGGTAVTLR